MQIDRRKNRVARAEEGLDNALRKLALAATVVKRWRRRLKTQQHALQKEMEARVAMKSSASLVGERKVRLIDEC